MRQAVWRTVLKADRDGKNVRIRSGDWPARCDECTEQMREMYACGFVERLRGTGERETPSGLRLSTCPQWVARQSLVESVWAMLGDYRGGRLGQAFDLPAALLDLLRVADAELTEWTSVQQERLSADG